MTLTSRFSYGLAVIGFFVVLDLVGRGNYLLFHSIVELFSVVIAVGIFVVAWETRRHSAGGFILFIGTAYFFVAIVDLLHLLSYKEMGVFPGTTANIPTQLWIAARYLQGLSLLAAAFLINRPVKIVPVIFIYTIIVAGILLTIHNGAFPVAFIDGKGLTPFKVASEYLISLVVAIAALCFWKRREYFDRHILNLLIWSMIATIASEMAFTLYVDVYGLLNEIGHMLKVLSFYLVYAAVIRKKLRQPYEALVVEIDKGRQAEEEINRINQELRTLNRIILTCATTLDVGALLDKVMAEALAITGLEGGTVCFVTPEETLHIAAHRATSEATLEDLSTNAVKVGDCLCGQCARDLEPLILADREAVLKFSTREATRGEDIRFHAAFPLISGERCVGVLCVFTRTDAKPDARSLKLLETVSAQIGMAIDNARLFAESVHQAVTLEWRVEERTRELAGANERLKEIDRLKSLFIASMSHELRTPLNSVIGFSSILLNEWIGTLNDEQKKCLTSVLRSGKHLLSLINDVIDVSKIEAGMIETGCDVFDLAELLAELEQGFAGEAQERGLFLAVQEFKLLMCTDRRRLLQCLLNLVSNALKFTEQGAVTVAVKHDEGQGVVTIAVTDSGIGIGVADQSRLFQAFSRIQSPLSAKVLGTGLGLYLTKKIVVEILHGAISVTSEPGNGSTFCITIPTRLEGEQENQQVSSAAGVKA